MSEYRDATATFFGTAFERSPVLAIIRGMDPAATTDVCGRAWKRGVTLVEVPIGEELAVRSLRAAVAAGRERGYPVGAGTVLTADQVATAAAAGAAFTVSPGWDGEVGRAARAAGMPHLPGVATATEIRAAMAAGHTWLKAFPATALGPGWFAAMSGPFPDARFVAVGGVDADNAAQFRAAGAHAVAVGSALRRDGELARLLTVTGVSSS